MINDVIASIRLFSVKYLLLRSSEVQHLEVAENPILLRIFNLPKELMGYCGIQIAKIIGGNFLNPFSSAHVIYFFNNWEIILHNPWLFVPWIKCTFIMNIFNMFKKHFKNFGNYTWQWFSTTIFESNNESAIIFTIFWHFFWRFTKIFFHHKCVFIITYKHGIYELPHELPNDLRLKELRKSGNIRKFSKLHRMIA